MPKKNNRFLDQLLFFYNCDALGCHPLCSILTELTPKQSATLVAFLTLINAPDDGQSILYMQPVFEVLLDAFERENSIQRNECVRQDMDTIFCRLANLSKSSIQFKRTSIHSKKESFSIYSFLFLTCTEGGASRIWKGELSPQFIALAPFLIRRIRLIKQRIKKVPKLYIYDLTLVARKLVVGSKDLLPTSTFNWSNQTKRKIATDAMAFQLINDENLMTESSHSYVMDLLFRNREEFDERSRSRRFDLSEGRIDRWLTYERQPSRTYQLGAEFEPDEGLFEPQEVPEGGGFQAPVHSSVLGYGDKGKLEKLRREVGEFDVDYQDEFGVELPASWWTDPYLAKLGTRGKVEALTYATRIQPWDKTCLSEQIIRQILLHSNGVTKPCVAVILLALLMNLGINSIEKIKVAVAPGFAEYDAEEIAKIKKGQIFVDIAHGIIWGASFLGESGQKSFY